MTLGKNYHDWNWWVFIFFRLFWLFLFFFSHAYCISTSLERNSILLLYLFVNFNKYLLRFFFFTIFLFLFVCLSEVVRWTLIELVWVLTFFDKDIVLFFCSVCVEIFLHHYVFRNGTECSFSRTKIYDLWVWCFENTMCSPKKEWRSCNCPLVAVIFVEVSDFLTQRISDYSPINIGNLALFKYHSNVI